MNIISLKRRYVGGSTKSSLAFTSSRGVDGTVISHIDRETVEIYPSGLYNVSSLHWVFYW